jgi:hypothetical protein
MARNKTNNVWRWKGGKQRGGGGGEKEEEKGDSNQSRSDPSLTPTRTTNSHSKESCFVQAQIVN